MKKVITLLFSLAAGISLHAQILSHAPFPDSYAIVAVDRGPSTVDYSTVSPLYRQVYSAPLHITKFSIPGEKKKKWGSIMTVAGGGLIIGGIVVAASGDPHYENTTYNQSTNTTTTNTVDPKYVLGGVMIVYGVGLTVPGIIIWRKGVRQYDQYMREQGPQSLRLGVGNGGAGVAYQF